MAQADAMSNAIRALIPGACVNPSLELTWTTHPEFVPSVAKQAPWPIPPFADAFDPEHRDTRFKAVLDAPSAYVTVILDDTAQNVAGGLELASVDARLGGLSFVAIGARKRAADGLAERLS